MLPEVDLRVIIIIYTSTGSTFITSWLTWDTQYFIYYTTINGIADKF
jgi:hypothetical protein